MKIRNCPKCNSEITYSNKYSYNNALKNNSICVVCRNKKNTKNPRPTLRKRVDVNCIECDKHFSIKKSVFLKGGGKYCSIVCKGKHQSIIYSGEGNPNYGNECSEHTKKLIGDVNRGRKHTEQSRLNMGNSHVGFMHSDKTIKKMKQSAVLRHKNNPFSDDTKRKMRVSAINRIDNKNGLRVNFNEVACEYFNWLNMFYDMNIQHALNGGEYHLKELGYFADGYDRNKNLWIEWDEPSHKYKKEKDKKRKQEITEYLGCDFIRINQSEVMGV